MKALLCLCILLLLPTLVCAKPSWYDDPENLQEQMDVMLVYAEYFYNFSAFGLGFIAAIITAAIWRG